jgi:hypothetical protein
LPTGSPPASLIAKPPEQQKAGASANSRPANRGAISMENHTANTSAEQRVSSFATLSDLGEYVHKINVLLRAAGITGAGEREDESRLVSLASDEAEKLEARYMAWASAPRSEAA